MTRPNDPGRDRWRATTRARALAEAYAVPLAEAERVVADVLMRGGGGVVVLWR